MIRDSVAVVAGVVSSVGLSVDVPSARVHSVGCPSAPMLVAADDTTIECALPAA